MVLSFGTIPWERWMPSALLCVPRVYAGPPATPRRVPRAARSTPYYYPSNRVRDLRMNTQNSVPSSRKGRGRVGPPLERDAGELAPHTDGLLRVWSTRLVSSNTAKRTQYP
jgi:hypothetical protein